MILESKFTDNVISLHYLIDVMVEANGRTRNAPWVLRTGTGNGVLATASMVQCLAGLLAQQFQALGMLVT